MSGCCCSSKGHGPHGDVSMGLWSREKKIRELEQELERAKHRVSEIEVLIGELKSES